MASLLVRTCCALTLVALWPTAAFAAVPPVPPEPLSPGDGASSAAGVTTFEVRSNSGDSYLGVHVSRSPRLTQDGVIDSDVAYASDLDLGNGRLSESSPGSGVYKWTPRYQKIPPGTYYWQTYRIDCSGTPEYSCYAAGPVRKLVITAAPGPTLTAPDAGATVPFGTVPTFSVRDTLADSLTIEVARSPALDPDRTFADSAVVASGRPEAASFSSRDFSWTPRDDFDDFEAKEFWKAPGTYYWHVLRRNCEQIFACHYDSASEARSFSVQPPPLTLKVGHTRARANAKTRFFITVKCSAACRIAASAAASGMPRLAATASGEANRATYVRFRPSAAQARRIRATLQRRKRVRWGITTTVIDGYGQERRETSAVVLLPYVRPRPPRTPAPRPRDRQRSIAEAKLRSYLAYIYSIRRSSVSADCSRVSRRAFRCEWSIYHAADQCSYRGMASVKKGLYSWRIRDYDESRTCWGR